ncbi:hypothetical protein FACS189431_0640 [Alphaproteobacteria bacterium]|nr:hypothetical protein FACS189431_0640 [Alphaproteobacteria bacterium]
MAFCKECGNKLADGSKFCDKCGAGAGAVASAAVKPTEVKPKTIIKKVLRGRTMILVSSIVLLCISVPLFIFYAIFTGVWGYSGGNGTLSVWAFIISLLICLAIGILGIVWGKKPQHSKKLLLIGGIAIPAVLFSMITTGSGGTFTIFYIILMVAPIIVLLALIMRGAVLNQKPPVDVKAAVRPDVVGGTAEVSNKTSTTAGLLGLFLGGLGIHDFYLGYKGLGVAHISIFGGATLLYITSIVLLFVAPIAGIVLSIIAVILYAATCLWGSIVGIIILTRPKSGRYAFDADGRVLQ